MTAPKDVLIIRGDFEEETLADLSARGRTLTAKRFERCTFVRCDFGEARFEDCRFDDCRFERCDLSNCKVPRTAFRGVEFDACKVMGVDWQQAVKLLFEVAFVDSELSYCTFVGHRLRGLRVHESRARDVDFSGCDLKRATFTRSDLAGARFERSDLRGADLSEATHVALDPARNRLGDTKISVDAGLETLARLGFVV